MSELVENGEVDLDNRSEELPPSGLTHGWRRVSAPQAAYSLEKLQHEVRPLADLGAGLRSQWEQIRGSSANYRSPFFSFDFINSVQQIDARVEIALARQGSKLLAILPFVRRRRHDGLPVGAGVNDAHGLLALSEYPLSFLQFLQRCGLRSYAFHAAPPETPDISRYEIGRSRSFLADLTVEPQGYEHYLRSTSTTIDRQGQKSRKLARQVGPLRLDYDCRDPAMIHYLIQMKAAQYQRTHTFNILGVEWIAKLLVQLHADRGCSVRGLLSVLYAGETPVALHYGLLEGDWLHYWFPVYDEQYAYGSPGTQMFLDIARQAAAEGVRYIDMGYGEQAYKHKLTNVITEMSHGLIDSNPWRRYLHRRRLGVRQQLKSVWFKKQLKPLVRRLLPNWDRNRYQH